MTAVLFVLSIVALSSLCRRHPAARWWSLLLAGLLFISVAWAWHSEGWRWSVAPLWGWTLWLGWGLIRRVLYRVPERVGGSAVTVAMFVAGLMVSSVAASLARTIIPIEFPAFTGEHGVGKMQWVLRSPVRHDLHDPDPFAPREFMVNVYYPALIHDGLRRAPYMSRSMADEIAGRTHPWTSFFLQSELRAARSRAYQGPGLSDARAKYPVVIFSPGHGFFADLHSFYLEELASHGYIVFALTHPGQAPVVEYPDGRRRLRVRWSDLDTAPQRQADIERRGERVYELRKLLNQSDVANVDEARIEEVKSLTDFMRYSPLSVRKEDMVELLDQLERLNAGQPGNVFAGRLDVDNIAMTGMSYGGPTAQEVCLEDARCKVVVNLDGEELGQMPPRTHGRPALWLYASDEWAGDYSVLRRIAYEHHGGPAFRVGFAGANHGTFADWPYFSAPVRWFDDPVARLLIGNHADRELPPLIVTYLLDFLDHYLKGAPLQLLDGNVTNAGVDVDHRNLGAS